MTAGYSSRRQGRAVTVTAVVATVLGVAVIGAAPSQATGGGGLVSPTEVLVECATDGSETTLTVDVVNDDVDTAAAVEIAGPDLEGQLPAKVWAEPDATTSTVLSIPNAGGHFMFTDKATGEPLPSYTFGADCAPAELSSDPADLDIWVKPAECISDDLIRQPVKVWNNGDTSVDITAQALTDGDEATGTVDALDYEYFSLDITPADEVRALQVSLEGIPLWIEQWSDSVCDPVRSDFTGDRKPDVVSVDSTGRLLVYPGNGKGSFLPKISLGAGWKTMTALVHPGDWDGDDKNDLLARDASGRLYLYPGNGKGGFGMRVAYGQGWSSMTAILGPGDFDGDGCNDLLARSKTGVLFLYAGDCEGGFEPTKTVSTGWGSITALVGPGDWDDDGCVDLLARTATGNLYRFPGTCEGTLQKAVLNGNGWSSMTAILAPRDWNGDGCDDLLARDAAGRLFLYPGKGHGTFMARVQIGQGWSTMATIVA